MLEFLQNMGAVEWLFVITVILAIISTPIMERNHTRSWCEYIDRMRTRWWLVAPFLFIASMSSMVAIMIYEYLTMNPS